MHLLALLLLTASLSARPLNVSWPSPGPEISGYRIYVRVPGEEWEPYAATADLSVSGEFPDEDFDLGIQTVTLTENNTVTVLSEITPKLVPANPPPVQRLVILIESSDDLVEWSPLASQVIEVDAESGRKFFRTVIEPAP